MIYGQVLRRLANRETRVGTEQNILRFHCARLLRQMKVLVTGGTGFTGSHTVRALLAAGHDVRLLVRDAGKVRRVFEPHGVVPADLTVGDMTDTDAVETALTGCDGVVHAAALVDLRRAAARRVEETNARGMEVVVGTAARRGLPSIVYVSSLGVFFVPGGPPLTPELPIAPGTTAYARSKSRAEVLARRLQDSGSPIRICYPCAILGPDDPTMSAAADGLGAWVAKMGLVTSGGMQYVDVRDVAALHVKLLELPPGPHRYAAAGEMISFPEIFTLLDELTGRHVRRVRMPGWMLRSIGSVSDVVMRIHDFEYPITRDSMEFMTRWPGGDAARTTRELGISFRSVAETFRDTLVWMYRAGYLTAAQAGNLALTPA